MSLNTRILGYLTVLTLPFVILVHLNSKLEMERFQNTQEIQLDDQQLLPNTEEIAAWSLNHKTAAADMLWLGAILYSSERRQMRLPRQGFTEYADRIIELDPHFHPIYYHHYSIRFELAVNPQREDLEAANRVLIAGLEHFPDDWQLARALTLNHIGRRFVTDDDEYIANLEQALRFAQIGAEAPDAPPEMTGIAISVRNRLHRERSKQQEESEAAHTQASPDEIEFFLRRYIAARSEGQRRTLRNYLRHMDAEDQLVERILEYEDQLRDSHRERYRYLPLELYLLIDFDLQDETLLVHR